jgi:hypothetical protein
VLSTQDGADKADNTSTLPLKNYTMKIKNEDVLFLNMGITDAQNTQTYSTPAMGYTPSYDSEMLALWREGFGFGVGGGLEF